MGKGVGDVGSAPRVQTQPKEKPQEKSQEKPKAAEMPQGKPEEAEKPESAEKPQEKPDVQGSKDAPEIEAAKIEAAQEKPEASDTKPESNPAQAQYYGDIWEPARQAEKVANGATPLPPQGTEVSASHDIKKPNEITGIRVEASAKVTNTKVEPGLNNTVTLEASASIGTYVGVEAGKEGQLQAGSARLAGQKFTYETKVSKEQEQAIRNGTAQLPNPFDPRGMPEGSAAVLKGQNYESTEFEAAYRNIAIENKVSDFKGAGMAVEKLDGNRVRISSGPVNAIENEAYVGLKDENLAIGLKNKRGLENSTMKVAELDVSTQEGMDKYQRFLLTGQVPEADGNTVSRSGTTSSLKLTNETSAQVSIGPVDINAQLMASEGERKTTQYTDGSKSDEINLSYGQGINLAINKETDFLGNTVASPDKPTYALTMGQVSPGASSYLASAYAEDPNSAEAKSYHNGPAQDVQISFTPEQAQELQRMAADYAQRHPSKLPGDTSQVMQQIAEARNSDEVAAVLAKVQSDGDLAEHLLRLRTDPANRATPLPGSIKHQNSP